MIRSALLALDASQASVRAQEIAIRISREQAAHPRGTDRPLQLTGVAVVDRPTIERPEAAPIGGGAYKVERDEAMLAEAEKRVAEILDAFEARCQAAGVPCATIRAEGWPYEQIESASRGHDLIVIGKGTNFHFETSNEADDTIKRLLCDNPRPLLVTPADDSQGASIVIAYDGSIQSAHALHMWTLLDLRRDQMEIHVVSVASDVAAAQSRCEEAATLLRFHDVRPHLHPIESTGTILDVLRERVPKLNPQMIVVGAFGQGGLRERFFGSVTLGLIQDSPYPLFLSQ